MGRPSSFVTAILLFACGGLVCGRQPKHLGTIYHDVRRSLLSDSHGQTPEAEEPLPELPAGYIYPVLAWGPNNQVAGLKEALVLGQLLKRTVIVHDILNHYDDKASLNHLTEQPDSMDFELIFNLSRLSRHRSVVTQAELRARGEWDGRLQAVAHFGDMFMSQIKNAHALNVSDEGAVYLDLEALDCTPRELAKLARTLKPYKYVGFILYENVVRSSGHGVKLTPSGNLCHDDYLRLSAQLTKSETLVRLATEFRREKGLGAAAAGGGGVDADDDGSREDGGGDDVGDGDQDVPGNNNDVDYDYDSSADDDDDGESNEDGEGESKSPSQGERYLAVHIRPYPDTCLYAWRREEYDMDLAARVCKNKKLHKVFVPQTLHAIKTYKLSTRVFVMSYPDLRPRISEMYGKKGLEAVFYDESDLEKAVGFKSISLLGMVEEEISFEADVFIGTSYSSMTGIIMQVRGSSTALERVARGKPRSKTLTFTKTT
ncbi:hypothetical protein Agub_g1131 [Astrephomene gubernaculifera]|uniref:O-fucosyltransferase family protein n=1 Tax=Astrephomene gubernaculifera TaxID=47775 RepID=A0AAD3DEW4_9CHLO|nr:hypothetical protein Agub_g1131 [Astrephomene gubernaculifera]